MTQRTARPPLAIVVAANVFRLRKERGLAQEKLAYAAGLSREVIRLLEGSRDEELGRGGLRLETVERLAEALEVDPCDLLRWDPASTRVYLKAKSRRPRLMAVATGGVVDPPGLLAQLT